MKKLIRSVGIMSAAVAFGAGSALVAPVAGAQSSLPGSSTGADDCAVTTTVTPDGLAAAGWGTPNDETPAVIGPVTDAGEDVGAAALTFPTDAEKGSSLYKDAGQMPLSELLDEDGGLLMNFDYTSGGQAPALQIRLHKASLAETETGAGHEIGFATITWSPENSNGEWKKANPAGSEDFWVTRALAGPDGNVIDRYTEMSLEEIVDLNPAAVITEYGVQKTKDNVAENVAIDNFTFGCETTDFELEPEGGLAGLVGSVSGIFQS